jgi:hypothetical protein
MKNENNEQKRVPIYISKGTSREDPNLFVSINGKNYILPRGKTSNVPPEVALEIERAGWAQEKLDAFIEKKAQV